MKDERCLEKVSYLRRRADVHVEQVRAAQRTRQERDQMQHTRQLKQLETTLAVHKQNNRQAQTDQERAEAALEQTKQLERLSEENRVLHEKLTEAQAQGMQSEAQAQAAQQGAVTRLEAALVARDKTIEVLRQQLMQARKNVAPSSAGAEAAALAPGAAELPGVA